MDPLGEQSLEKSSPGSVSVHITVLQEQSRGGIISTNGDLTESLGALAQPEARPRRETGAKVLIA
jgi:hypothetical protein